MICYKDRTYCGSNVEEHTCGREFTEQDAVDAEKWCGVYEYSYKRLLAGGDWSFQHQGTIYFTTKDKLKHSQKVHRKEWLIVLGVNDD